ncbi:MAG: hypothetical protein H6611_03145 [Ignavibacteriales bacterium]|nr:hypothetical protein [Ignavibacteriales bacterium]
MSFLYFYLIAFKNASMFSLLTAGGIPPPHDKIILDLSLSELINYLF